MEIIVGKRGDQRIPAFGKSGFVRIGPRIGGGNFRRGMLRQSR